MNKNLGTIGTPSLGLVKNSPSNNNTPVEKVPNMNDLKAIEAQREVLRQQELARAKQPPKN